MNKEFERCCRQIAKMMEKYSSLILQDIDKEILLLKQKIEQKALKEKD